MFSRSAYYFIALSTATVLMQSATMAAPPRKPSLGAFKRMIDHSPFTVKPDKTVATQLSPLERDWALASVTPHGDGFFVTLMNKKDRTNRIRFLKGFSAGEYELLEVQQDFSDRMNTKVKIRKGIQTAWISYDNKLLQTKPKPKLSSVRTSPTPKNSAPPGVTSSSSGSNVVVPRRTRRVVPAAK